MSSQEWLEIPSGMPRKRGIYSLAKISRIFPEISLRRLIFLGYFLLFRDAIRQAWKWPQVYSIANNAGVPRGLNNL